MGSLSIFLLIVFVSGPLQDFTSSIFYDYKDLYMLVILLEYDPRLFVLFMIIKTSLLSDSCCNSGIIY